MRSCWFAGFGTVGRLTLLSLFSMLVAFFACFVDVVALCFRLCIQTSPLLNEKRAMRIFKKSCVT
jgi:hypothetical protein